MIVAIDGPSGAGKSTLAKRVAKELRFTYLDTGAIYRALALKILRRGVDLNDTAALSAIVIDSDIDLRGSNGQIQVFLDGEDVSASIRTPEVSQMASKASAIPMVRHRLLDLQRELGRRGNVVAEGRDIGTVVFPDAQVQLCIVHLVRHSLFYVSHKDRKEVAADLKLIYQAHGRFPDSSR